MTDERWAPVAEYEGLYEVSDQGRVRSVRREVNSPLLPGGTRIVRERMMRITVIEDRQTTVVLMRNGKAKTFNLKNLVMDAFAGPRPKGHIARYLNGYRDCRLEALAWVPVKRPRSGGPVPPSVAWGQRRKDSPPDDIIRAIRRLAASGENAAYIGRKLGIKYYTAWRVVNGYLGRHVPVAEDEIMPVTTEPKVYAKRLDGIEMPPSISRLPVHSELKVPIPWFVSRPPGSTGDPDLRYADPEKMAIAHKHGLCWVCGVRRYSKRLAFVTGPMCVVTTTSAELPCHPQCARFSVRACPFLTQPRMRRNEKDVPENKLAPAGHAIMRNPGVSAILITTTYRPFADGNGGVLFEMGPPDEVTWWAQGRPAYREEVEQAMRTGLPTVMEQAKLDGVRGIEDLDRKVQAAMRWLPTIKLPTEYVDT